MVEAYNREQTTEYMDRYIAFVDILGFKETIRHKTCSEIVDIFSKIRVPHASANIARDGKWIQFMDASECDKVSIKVMSDSICFYIGASEPSALLILATVCLLFQRQMANLPEPVLMRGGIVRGELYANNDVTFGTGLTDAYLLEENNARYPRIILPGEVVKQAMKHMDGDAKNCLSKILAPDDDMFYTIDYTALFQPADAARLMEYTENKLDTETSPSIREKYLYLRKKLERLM